MLKFNKLEYPTCPHCQTLINDIAIFDLHNLTSHYATVVVCPSCERPFGMKSRIELTVEVFDLDEKETIER